MNYELFINVAKEIKQACKVKLRLRGQEVRITGRKSLIDNWLLKMGKMRKSTEPKKVVILSVAIYAIILVIKLTLEWLHTKNIASRNV